jgi:hypothetical protein
MMIPAEKFKFITRIGEILDLLMRCAPAERDRLQMELELIEHIVVEEKPNDL